MVSFGGGGGRRRRSTQTTTSTQERLFPTRFLTDFTSRFGERPRPRLVSPFEPDIEDFGGRIERAFTGAALGPVEEAEQRAEERALELAEQRGLGTSPAIFSRGGIIEQTRRPFITEKAQIGKEAGLRRLGFQIQEAARRTGFSEEELADYLRLLGVLGSISGGTGTSTTVGRERESGGSRFGLDLSALTGLFKSPSGTGTPSFP